MDFPLNKLPPPKYTDKPSKHKKIEKTVLVSHIDHLFNDSYLKNYFNGHKKTHQKMQKTLFLGSKLEKMCQKDSKRALWKS